jgi:hypothetical protein
LPYTNIKDFRKRVIDVAIDEINRSDNISFTIDYDLLKTGRKITTTALGDRAVLVLEFIEFKQETTKDEESFFIKIR